MRFKSHIPLLIACSTLFAQYVDPLPEEPKSIVMEGASHNGLGYSDTRPWHIKVTYDVIDADGDEVSSGTVEKFWLAPDKQKTVYESDKFHQTEWQTPNGRFRSEDQDWPKPNDQQALREYIEPIPIHSTLDGVKYLSFKKSIGKVELTCVTLVPSDADKYLRMNGYDDKMRFPHYCFAPDQLMLRFKSSGGGFSEVFHNDVVLFHDRYIARQSQVNLAGKPRLKMHVEVIESLQGEPESFLKIPADAQVVNNRILVSADILMNQAIKKNFPDRSVSKGISGHVMMRFTVGKDGHVMSAKAIDGTEALRPLMEDAVMKWVFRPYLIEGKPVEVETQMGLDMN